VVCHFIIKSINKVIFVYVLLFEDGFCNIKCINTCTGAVFIGYLATNLNKVNVQWIHYYPVIA